MSFKQFMKAKTVGEYLQAKKDPEKMAEIESRTVGEVLDNAPIVPTNKKASKVDKSVITCPKCKSINVQFMQQDKKVFSAKKAVAGTLVLGGAVLGFLGEKGKKQWHCQDCGSMFETK
ncbi:hypothetical protein [Streptococcus parauberis]|uniref:hypothetical protein n=1 Tax=Streptococcus parauberis TaxID=1348 RepID=UPI000789B3CD|nr:hypothetical protein [Streptococcus parauberis]KYP21664.1 hypothetical protein AKL14_00575 [Streptococcus parauberis]KYP21839.1 hypothetical protein AKL13_00339 [Streptococcus parauberis]KYP21943.1 hypothetical protein TN39_00192 [Streptococcus parauberis]KYP23731.1 hypothetical protein ADO04_01607 [Streptococcus parauberis]KYP25356.1 hypothetical protein TP84_01658 [Streptococcus parauberis]